MSNINEPQRNHNNIIIVPTVACKDESLSKKLKLDTPEKETEKCDTKTSTPSDDKIEKDAKVVQASNNCAKKDSKAHSWASNYLQSIGQQAKPKMNLSLTKKKMAAGNTSAPIPVTQTNIVNTSNWAPMNSQTQYLYPNPQNYNFLMQNTNPPNAFCNVPLNYIASNYSASTNTGPMNYTAPTNNHTAVNYTMQTNNTAPVNYTMQTNNPAPINYAASTNISPQVNYYTPTNYQPVPNYTTPINNSSLLNYNTPVNYTTPINYNQPVNYTAHGNYPLPNYSTPINDTVPINYSDPINQAMPSNYNTQRNISTPLNEPSSPLMEQSTPLNDEPWSPISEGVTTFSDQTISLNDSVTPQSSTSSIQREVNPLISDSSEPNIFNTSLENSKKSDGEIFSSAPQNGSNKIKDKLQEDNKDTRISKKNIKLNLIKNKNDSNNSEDKHGRDKSDARNLIRRRNDKRIESDRHNVQLNRKIPSKSTSKYEQDARESRSLNIVSKYRNTFKSKDISTHGSKALKTGSKNDKMESYKSAKETSKADDSRKEARPKKTLPEYHKYEESHKKRGSKEENHTKYEHNKSKIIDKIKEIRSLYEKTKPPYKKVNDNKPSTSKIRRSRTPEPTQRKRPRTDSDIVDKDISTKRISPIKSVVQPLQPIIIKYPTTSPKRLPDRISGPEHYDLRSKLSRANKYFQKNLHNKEHLKDRDNLVVTINQPEVITEPKPKSPPKVTVTEKKAKTKKYKTIKFTIKVLCRDGEGSASSHSDDSEEELNSAEVPSSHNDLSFLDDFNVDEIVDSLKNAQKRNVNIQNKNQSNTKDTVLKNSKLSDTVLETVHQDSVSEYNDCIILDDSIDTKNVKIEKKYETKENESTVCILLDTVTKVKTEPLDESKESDDCVILDPVHTTNIKTEHNCINETNKSCIILDNTLDTISIKSEPNDNVINIKQYIKSEKLEDSDDCIIIETEENQIKEETSVEIKLEDTISEQIQVKSEHNEIEIPIDVKTIQLNMDKIDVMDTEQHMIDAITGQDTIQPKMEAMEPIGQDTDQDMIEVMEAIAKQPEMEAMEVIGQDTEQDMIEVMEAIAKQPEMEAMEPIGQDTEQNMVEAMEVIDQDTEQDMIKAMEPKGQDIEQNNRGAVKAIGEDNDQINIEAMEVVSQDTELEKIEAMEAIGNDIEYNNIGAMETTGKDTNEDILKSHIEVLNTEVLETPNVINEPISISPIKDDIKINDTIKILKMPSTDVDIKPKMEIIEVPIEDPSKIKSEKEKPLIEIEFLPTQNLEVNNNNPENMVASTIAVKKEDLKNIEENSHENINTSCDHNENKKESTIYIRQTEGTSIEKAIKQEIINNIEPELTHLKSKDSQAIINMVAIKAEEIINTTKAEPTNVKPDSKPNATKSETEKRQVTIIKKKENEELSEKDGLESRMLEYLQEPYKIVSLIHDGKFSKIFKCNDSKDRNYAVKLLKSPNDRVSLGVEKENIFQQIQKDIPKENLNIVMVINGFGIERRWALLMDYYPTDLKTVLRTNRKGFSLDQLQLLARQLITAVMVLRNYQIVHSDIRPSHILVDQTKRNLKLCGFDSCYHTNKAQVLPNIGTVSYRAPEIIMGFSASFSIDVWSSATVLYEMFTKRKLFIGIYNNQILYNQLCMFGEMPFDMIQRSKFHCNHFVGRCFVRRSGPHGAKRELVYKFHKTQKLYDLLLSSYKFFWGTSNKLTREEDLMKLISFYELLDKMFVIDPRHRLPIEFVCADPFINEIP